MGPGSIKAGWRAGLRGAIAALALALAQGAALAQSGIIVDATLGNSPFEVTAPLIVDGAAVVADTSTGVVNQSGSSVGISRLLCLGNAPSGTGTYNLQGGTLEVGKDGDWEYGGVHVGEQGTGMFVQTGGIHTIYRNLALAWEGAGGTSVGTYRLSGGTLNVGVDGYDSWGESIGEWGTGRFDQTGGTHSVYRDLYVGYEGTGTYNLSGGALTVLGNGDAGGECVGFYGGGTFNQSGGVHTVGDAGLGSLMVASVSSTGIFNLSGGKLTVADALIVGGFGQGIFRQTGGALETARLGVACGGSFVLTGGACTVSDTLIVAGGTFDLSGGLLRAPLEFFADDEDCGSFTHTGGTNIATAIDLGVGTYELSGSALLEAFTLTGDLLNGGTVNPGNSVGTMTVSGNYTQQAPGTLVIEAESPTSYDKLQVLGTATLDGTLKPALLGGYVPRNHQVFTGVLEAGVLEGAFRAVTNFTPTLTAVATYVPSQSQGPGLVDLTAVRNYTNPVLGLDDDQLTIGNMLNALPDTGTGELDDILHALDSLPTREAVLDAFKQISPEKADALLQLSYAEFYKLLRNLARRISDQRFQGGGPDQVADTSTAGGAGKGLAGGTGLVLSAFSSGVARLVTGDRGPRTKGSWELFVEPNISPGRRSTTEHGTGYDFTIAGFALGADRRVADHVSMGLATGYDHIRADFTADGGDIAGDSWPVMAYAAYTPEHFYAFGSAGYTHTSFDVDRRIAFDVLRRTAHGSTSAKQCNFYGEAGRDLRTHKAVVTPYLSLASSRVDVDGFTESGAGALNLAIGPQSGSSLQSGLGVKVTARSKTHRSREVVGQFHTSYQHEFKNDARGIDASLARGSLPLTWTTGSPGRDFALVGGNVSLATRKNLTGRVDYQAEVFRRDYAVQNVNVGLCWRF